MRKIATAVTIAAIAVVGPVGVPTAAQAAEMCQGEPATVVIDGTSSSGAPTEGPDVIVSYDQVVNGLGGDDLICVRGGDFKSYFVRAGSGNDVVDARGNRGADFRAWLGAGADTYIGGDGKDKVWGADDLHYVSEEPQADTERDVFKTGGGRDEVHSGSVGMANLDRINTSRESDTVDLIGLSSGGTLDMGGRERNSVTFRLASSPTTRWVVDADNQTYAVDGDTSTWGGRITSFEFQAAEADDRGTLRFLGDSAGETVIANSWAFVTDLRTRGGHDLAYVAGRPGGSYRLGTGNNRLFLSTGQATDIDLGAHTVDIARDGVDGAISGVDTFSVSAPILRLAGSAGADDVRARGCDIVLRGLAGADKLNRLRNGVEDCEIPVVSMLLGGPGDDRLTGSSRTDDIINGGQGFDRAVGNGGTDVCRAEVTDCPLT